MADLFEIEKWGREFLEAEKFEDGCWNGVQIEGKREVKRVIGGVTFDERLLEKAIEKKADLILVHHGFFGKEEFVVRGRRMKLVKKLVENGIGLMGFHLPLDGNLEIGMNASLIRMLGTEKMKPWKTGFVGELGEEKSAKEVKEILEEKLGAQRVDLVNEKKMVKKVAAISGRSAWFLESEVNMGMPEFDMFVTGDWDEHRAQAALEMDLAWLSLGHDATEKEGVKNLGKMMAEKFGIEFEFVEIENEF